MLNLVYDSMFLLRELCGTLCSSVTVSLIGFVSDKCSFVVALVDGLFIYGYIFLRFDVHSGWVLDVYTSYFLFYCLL